VNLPTIKRITRKLSGKETLALRQPSSQEPSILVNGLRVPKSDKAKESFNGQMAACTKVIGKKTKHAEKVACSTLT